MTDRPLDSRKTEKIDVAQVLQNGNSYNTPLSPIEQMANLGGYKRKRPLC